MRLVRVLAGAALPLLLSACVVHVTEDGAQPMAWGEHFGIETVDLESVRAARIEGGRLIVRVDSNGCTDADDFVVLVQEHDAWTGLGVQRQSPDMCKAYVPDGVELSWDAAAPGIAVEAEARLLNPLRLTR